jgi:Putative Flp pilus-assembly TadE/G-like
MVALWLPIAVLFVIFVVDVGNWFEHKRHLQMQADAGALAGGGRFTVPCVDGEIVAETRNYAGDPEAPGPDRWNVFGPSEPANVHVLLNSVSYWNEGGTNYSDGGTPCSARMVDVKITEADVPLFFDAPGFDLDVVPAINAHARVRIETLHRLGGALPVAVPDPTPKLARAFFINEETGAEIASTPLTKSETPSPEGFAIWDNATVPVSVPINTSKIGVRIALSGGGGSTTCGDPLVACYDLGSANGVLHVRGYSTSGRGADTNPPVAQDVHLTAGTCSDAYFSDDATACGVGIEADIAIGTVPTDDIQIKAFGGNCGNNGCLLTYSTGLWRGTVPTDPAVGPVPIELRWQQKNGSITGLGTCSTTFRNNNACQGTFGDVHRTFRATGSRSGPIELAQIWEGSSFWANSFPLGSTHDLVVKIGIRDLQIAQDVNDELVTLRVTGSQNQSIDCDPDIPNLAEEIAQGCGPVYEINEGTPCPATAPSLWSGPEPWNCVAVQTGGAVGQVERGLRDRILGGSNSCTSPSNWSQFPNIPAGDSRIVPMFLTPFETFTGSGNEVFPVTNFGTFYVTGWFGDPCPGADPVPGRGYIVGHFIKYIYSLNEGGGNGELCNFAGFGSCVAVLTD